MSKRKSALGVEPRKEPKQERSRQTYQVILQGASKIIRKDGIEKFSTNRVAEESGVSIGSLYQYFPSKEAIIAALVDQLFDLEYLRMKELLASLYPQVGAREVLKKILSCYFYADHADLIFRKTLIDSISTVKKQSEALRFHRSMSELILNYLYTNFKCEPARVDQDTVIFMFTYMLRSAALSSVDESIKDINKKSLIQELVEMSISLLGIQSDAPLSST